MNDWIVQLSGPEQELEFLAENFSNEPSIFTHDDDYFLESRSFGDVEDVRDVREIAEAKLDIIKNVVLFEWGSLGKDTRIEGIGVFRNGKFRAQSKVAGQVTVREPVPEENEIENLVPEVHELLAQDPPTKELLNLLAQGDSWVNLYRVYEFVEDTRIGEQSPVEKGWISTSEKNLFKHTANSRRAIGDQARHGREQKQPPDDPMEHQKAKMLISNLVREWLLERHENIVDG